MLWQGAQHGWEKLQGQCRGFSPPPEGMTCSLHICAVLTWGAATSAWFPEGTFTAQRLSKVIKEITKILVSPRTDKI